MRIMPYLAAGGLALAALKCSHNSNTHAEQPESLPPVEAPSSSADASAPTTGMDASANGEQADASSSVSDASTDQDAETGTAHASVGDPKLSDAQIAGITRSANAAEIAQATLARQKSRNSEVREFARMMIAQHGDAQREQTNLDQPIDSSAISERLSHDAERVYSELSAKSGAEFDRAYVKAQIEQHRQVLDTLENQLLPSVQSPALRGYLEQIKPAIERHLQASLKLEQSLEESSRMTSGQ